MKRCLLLLLVVPLLFACDEEKYSTSDEVKIRPLKMEEKFLVNASNEFAFNVLKNLDNEREGNVVFSPLGLGMTAGILSNSVEEVNYKLLGVQELQPIEVNKAFYEVETMLPGIDPHVQLNFANALWNKESFSFSEDFTSRVMAYYNADVRSMNFDKQSSENYISKWMKLKTEHRFTGIQNMDKHDDVYLLNASTFSFPYYSESEPNAKMEYQDLPTVFSYENESIILNEYMLGKNTYSLVTITPTNGQPLSTLIKNITVENFEHYRSNVKSSVPKQLPSMDFKYEHNFSKIFSQQNWLTHFVINQSVKNLDHAGEFKFNVTHKAAIDINFNSPSMKEVATSNYQPHLFFITEPNTNLLLFAGVFGAE